jgi:carbonic anhydrase/acetyltransferase-like protein (isoleucine patch superfamily)
VLHNARNTPERRYAADPLRRALKLRLRLACGLRGRWITWRLRAIGAHVGKGLLAERGVQISTIRGADWHVGDGVSLGTGVIISVSRGARLHLGDHVRINHYAVLAAEESIVLGAGSGVAEHSSVRDHDHDVTPGPAPWAGWAAAPVVSAPIVLGPDTWVCRGSAVLRGSRIGAGAIIGANAVVRGEIPANAVAVGIPARVVRYRAAADGPAPRGPAPRDAPAGGGPQDGRGQAKTSAP